MNSNIQLGTRQRVKQILGIVLIILAACVLYGFFAGFRANLGIISTIIADGLPLISYGDINTIFFVFTIVNGLATPLMGYLTVKKSNLFVLILGCIFIAIGMFGMAVCSTLIGLAIAIDFFFAVGSSALSFAVIFSLVAPCIGEKAAAIASGVINCSSTFFATVLAPDVVIATNYIGFTNTLLFFALIAIIFIPLSIILALFRRKKAIISAEKKKEIHFISVCKTIFSAPWFYMLVPCYFIYGFCCQGITNHLFMDDVAAGISELTSSMALSVANLAMTVGMLVIGFIAAKSKKHLLLISITVIAIVIFELLYTLIQAPIPLFICLVVLCVVGGAILPLASLVTAEMTEPIYIATALGIMHIVGKFSQGLNFQFGGYIFDLTGDINILCLIQTGLAVVAAVMLFISMRILIKSRKKDEV